MPGAVLTPMLRDATAPGRVPALAAAVLAFASAAVSLFWTLGGTLLLDTVGGALEDLARTRSPPAVMLGVATVAIKGAAGVLALQLAGSAPPGRRVLVLTAAAAAVLSFWGGANVLAGSLVLAGVIDPGEPVDEHALRWHVVLWDPWFVVWGVALAWATRRAWRAPKGS
jgi:hypothetical protein